VRLLVVIEKTKTGFSAYSPDFPGCVATGRTHETVERAMQKVIAFHLTGMRAKGLEVPTPRSYSTYVEVVLPATVSPPARSLLRGSIG
jgi:predicted RNase H-like HicB family nuclease